LKVHHLGQTGYDYNNWLPAAQQDLVDKGIKAELRPEGHSLVYPGLHYLLFETMNYFGLENPKIQMLVIRFLHALLGVWLVWLVFVLSKRLTCDKNARLIAWVSAVGWAMAFLSVRNLVEIACIPFMILSLIQVHKGMSQAPIKYGIIAGIYISLAISIRYQLFVFFGVLGLILLFQKRRDLALSMLLGFVLGFGLLQGVLDYLIWGYPFAEMIEYFTYNSGDARYDYAQANASFFGLNYWLVLAFVTVPVLGVFWFFGFFTQWRKNFWLFAPAFAFLLFHMAYINLQERFIFPIMHVVLILGIIGWNDFKLSSKFWKAKSRLWNGIKQLSWSLNLLLLIFATSYYGKKARVEAAFFLYTENSFNGAYQENINDGYIPLLPMHYARKWDFEFRQIMNVQDWEANQYIASSPRLIFFHGSENLNKRVEIAETYLGSMVMLSSFQPSWQDKLIQWINPINRNDAIYLYLVSSEH